MTARGPWGQRSHRQALGLASGESPAGPPPYPLPLRSLCSRGEGNLGLGFRGRRLSRCGKPGSRPMADGSVQGVTQDRYAAARTQFEENLAKGEDIGASFCATVEGETVVDLW